MKLLITGGNGYLAKNLKPLLIQNGYNVLAPTHSELDLLNFNLLADYLNKNKFDAIIHTAIKGGRRNNIDTFENAYIPNIQMFENLSVATNIPIIIIGSGAEFDRRDSINNTLENSVFNKYPIDPYGLSKNIITRRAITNFDNIWVLRLFGCFDVNEDDTRFIKRSILRLKQGLPIEINNNCEMDFFYLDDVFTVIDYILKHDCPRNINLTYNQKMDLVHIASLIHKHTGILYPYMQIEKNNGKSYTGNCEILYSLPINLIGLEEGIKRTCKLLL